MCSTCAELVDYRTWFSQTLLVKHYNVALGLGNRLINFLAKTITRVISKKMFNIMFMHQNKTTLLIWTAPHKLFIHSAQSVNNGINKEQTQRTFHKWDTGIQWQILWQCDQCSLINPSLTSTGTTVIQVTATDADDPMFGNNAKLIYSILEGEPYFSVEPKTGANPMLDNNLYALNSRT